MICRPFYLASSAHPVSFLIPYPREILNGVVTDCEQRKPKKSKKKAYIAKSLLLVKQANCQGTRPQQHKQDQEIRTNEKTVRPSKI